MIREDGSFQISNIAYALRPYLDSEIAYNNIYVCNYRKSVLYRTCGVCTLIDTDDYTTW